MFKSPQAISKLERVNRLPSLVLGGNKTKIREIIKANQNFLLNPFPLV